MLPYYVRKKEQGFTLIEILCTLTIVGILSAIAIPSWLSWYNNSQVKSSLEELNGALTQAQRQAMRRGKSCTITLDTTNNKITASTGSEGCLLSDRTLPKGVVMTTNIGGSDIKFSRKGSTTTADLGVVVLSLSNGSGEKRCLIVSTSLGAMKTGIYNGTNSSPTSSNCSTPD